MRNKTNTIKIIAPAKVNLFLAVGNHITKNNKSYHEVLNVLHTLLLHDVIYINFEDSNKTEINIEFLESKDINLKLPQIPTENNLIYIAINNLLEIIPKKINKKLNIYIEKNIPLQAGLAGGSSDAAAALIGLAKILGIKAQNKYILEAAEKTGSDVPFFLEGGCALYTENGSTFSHKIQPINREIVLVKPNSDDLDGLSTKQVYKQFDLLDLNSDFDTKFSYKTSSSDNSNIQNQGSANSTENKASLREIVKSITFADNIPLFNNLAAASENLMPQLTQIKNWLTDKVGQKNVLLCGSGSATFAIIPEDVNSEEIVEDALSRGYWSIKTQLANVKTKIMPYNNMI